MKNPDCAAIMRIEIYTPFSAIDLKVVKLFISPAHNYFGHHGRPSGRHPLAEKRSIVCVGGRGVEGDRFFDFKENYKGQITFFRLKSSTRSAGRWA